MLEKSHSFNDLEKQLAKDSLEMALKNLHEEINREIAKNKNDFSSEIQKTLTGFRQNLEKSVSEEIDKKLSSLFENNFYAISEDVKKSFEKAFDPVFENTKNDMKRLHVQGESTLSSWEEMMSRYKSLWTKPFFIMFSASILTGTLVSFLSSYYLTRQMRETMQTHESLLISYKNLALDYFEREKAREKEIEKKKANSQPTNNKKKK
jgi:hypothetical protein